MAVTETNALYSNSLEDERKLGEVSNSFQGSSVCSPIKHSTKAAGKFEDGTIADQTNTEKETSPHRTIKGVKWALVVTSMLGSTFLYALDNTVVADVQVDIIRSLGGTEKLPWLGTAFAWATMSTILPWSKLYNLFDAKWLYISSSTIFELGSAICGAAPTMNAMIVGRSIAGLGASGMYIGCLTLLSVSTTEQERPTYMGYTGISWGSGFILGPIIGGAFAQSPATWRWAFYLNLLLFVVFAPIFLFLLPNWQPMKDTSFWERAKMYDWLGSLLQVAGSLAGIIAISFGGTVYPWNGGEIIGSFVAAGVLGILFLLQQHFEFLTTKASRVFPLHFIKDKTMIVVWILIAAPSWALLVPIYYQPLFFQYVRLDSPVKAAVRLLPVIVPFVAFAMIGGSVVSKTGRYYPWYLVGGILSVAGSALMYADVDKTSVLAKPYAYSALIGTGCGMAGQLSYSIAQFKVPKEQLSNAIGFICTGQYFGLTMSLITSGAIFQNLAQDKIAAVLPPNTSIETIRMVIQGGTEAIAGLGSDMQVKVLDALLAALNKTYIVSLSAACLALVTVIFLK